MNSHLGVGQTLALLNQLRDLVRDFAEQENRLNQELRVQVATERRRGDTTAGQQRAKLTEAIGAADAAAQTRRTNLEAFYAARLTRISRAMRASFRVRLLSKSHIIHEIMIA